jgi:ribosomal protein S15P/S13E
VDRLGLVLQILSIVAYLKQRGILAQDWKMFGLNVRR